MHLVVNIGNTTLLFGWKNGESIDTHRIGLHEFSQNERWEELQDRLIENVEVVHVMQTNTKLQNEVIAYIQQTFQAPLKYITKASPWNIQSMYDIEHIGIDRMAVCAGVQAQGVRSAAIIDCGTATTLTILQKGCITGGKIRLGVRKELDVLKTLIPSIDIDAVMADASSAQYEFGMNTHENIISGVCIGHAQLLKYWIKACRQTYGDIPIYITGGNGAVMFAYLHTIKRCTYDPNILVCGMLATVDQSY